MNTTRHSSGEILTGRLWRKENAVIRQLPFYSKIAGIDNLADPFEVACGDGSFKTLLIVRLILSFLLNVLTVSC